MKTFLSVLNTFIQLCIGATTMAVCVYGIAKSDLHSLLCCIGYNFFMAEAILSLNPSTAWTSFMSLERKRFVHLFMQLCAIILALTGSLAVLIKTGSDNMKYAHTVVGLLALVFGILTFLAGPFALFYGVEMKTTHICFGIPAYALAIGCLILGLLKNKFTDWAGAPVTGILIGIICVHSTLIVVMVFLRCIRRIMN